MWFLWWLRHGAIGPSEATLLWVSVDWLDVGIDIFNLVIRVSKVEQLASRLCTVFWTVPWEPWNQQFFFTAADLNSQKPPFWTAAQAFRIAAWQNRQQTCPFPAGVVTLVSGEVEHIMHLIRWNLNSRLCPCGWTWPRPLFGNNARLSRVELGPFNFNCSGCFTLVTN